MRSQVVQNGWFPSVLAAHLLLSCREPTQVIVEITTDINCADRPKTGIAVGALSQLESRPVSTETEQCDSSTGRIGSIVIVPGGEKDSDFAIRVVTGITMSADDCVTSGYGAGCVVARRALGFVPQETLHLPIRIEASCIGVPCEATQTCRSGSCVSATITNPNDCLTASGCDVVSSSSGGTNSAGTGGAGSGLGGSLSQGGTSSESSVTGGGGTTNTAGIGGAPATGGTTTAGGAPAIGGESAMGGVPATGGAFAIGGVPATGGASATGGTVATGGVPASGGTVATGGVPASGGTVATGGAHATGGDTAIGSVPASGGATATGGTATTSGGSASTSFTPTCVTATKGGTCTSTDTQLCYYACGPMETGHKTEICTSGAYVEGDCQFPTNVNYSCFKVPQADSADCPTTEPQTGQPCSISKCLLPCSGTACEMCGVATGYHDSTGTQKVGYCVCTSAGKWSCASTTAWPCPASQGC